MTSYVAALKYYINAFKVVSESLRPSITEFQNGCHQFFLGYLSGPFYQNYVLVAIHGHLNPETTTEAGLDSLSE